MLLKMVLSTIPLIGMLIALVNGLHGEDIYTTKVFIMSIGPWFFNWTNTKNSVEPGQFSYQPSLMNAPDLPDWMHYTHSERRNKGFLYGAPPPGTNDFEIGVIGVDRNVYDVRHRVISMNVIENTEPAEFEVQLKVDRLNIEDMLGSDHYDLLIDVFRKHLWPESKDDLSLTFLASATHLGGRLPLKPSDGEGIVIHIGSREPFSQILLDLQDEVQPLRSKGLINCPDFKRTSVERFFKEHNFFLDWCAFRLNKRQLEGHEPPSLPPELQLASEALSENLIFVNQDELPERNYVSELLPMIILHIVALITFILGVNIFMCYWKDEEPIGHSRYDDGQQTSDNIPSLSSQREQISPRMSLERPGLRPQPPPYNGLQNSPYLNADEEEVNDEEARTWYC